MHFNIDADNGNIISGWLAPDNPQAAPRVIVVTPGLPEIEVEAEIVRPDIVALGVHPTGRCGFQVTTAAIPELPELKELQLLEGESRLPIHGRFIPGRHVAKKLFIFDCSLTPQRRIFDYARSRFSLSYANSEHLGLETTLSVISNHFTKSLFITGRSLLLRYDHFLKDKDYVRAALLRQPYEELAERLLFLHLLSKGDIPASLEIYTTGVSNLIDFARNLPFNDQRAMTLAFRNATEKQRLELASPMTRVFGCDIDEFPRRGNVSRALDNLATLQVVGTRERYDAFRDLLAGVLNADILGPGAPSTFQSVEALAEKLARIGPVTDLLAEDLALYSYVEESVVQGLQNAGAGAEA